MMSARLLPWMIFLFALVAGCHAAAEAQGDLSWEQKILNGERCYHQANYSEARINFLEACSLARTPKERVISLISRGDCDFITLRNAQARAAYMEAVDICEKENRLKDSLLSCICLNDVAATLLEEDQIPEAAKVLQSIRYSSLPLSAVEMNRQRSGVSASTLFVRDGEWDDSVWSVGTYFSPTITMTLSPSHKVTGGFPVWRNNPHSAIIHWIGIELIERLVMQDLKQGDLDSARSHYSGRKELIRQICGDNSEAVANMEGVTRCAERYWQEFQRQCISRKVDYNDQVALSRIRSDLSTHKEACRTEALSLLTGVR